MLSYKQIISKFQEFAENHFYIKSYGTGEAFQIVEHDKQKIRKYPMMWVEDQPFPFATGSVTYSFRVYFLQQVPTLKNTDPETLEQINVVEAKSDMLQCAQDLMSFWVQDHNYPDLDVLKSTLGTPFHDTLMDSLTGFYIDIKLEQGFKYDSCSIPMTGIDPPPTPGCDDVLVTFNGVSVTSTPSGNTKTVIVQSDAAGNPQVGTITADTATELTIEVPAGGATSLDISVNGSLLIPGATTNQDIIVFTEGSGAQVGSADGGEWQILDSIISNSDDTYSVALEAQDTLELPDITHTQTDGSPEILPAQTPLVCNPASPASNQVNGASKTDIPAGGSKDFQIEYANGDPVVVVQISDSATLFKGTVPTPPAIITSNVINTGQETVYRTGDDGDRFSNGDYASVNMANLSDYYTLSEVNEWGHFKRLTGDTGGYMDETTGNFFDVNGVSTTKLGAFPNEILRDYCTRRRWFLRRSAARSWNDCVTLTLTESRGGETGWFCPNRSEYESLSSANVKSPSYIDNRLFNWSVQNMWCSTTEKNITTNSLRYNGSVDTWTTEVKIQTNANAYVKLF